MEEKWLKWAKELQSIGQAGEYYSKDKFDIERFTRIREISAEIMSEYTEIDIKKVKEIFCNETGYQTPKIDVRGVIFKDDKILLVQEKSDGKWALPGGWAEFNLSLRENVEKEILEEAGLIVKSKKIIAVHENSKHQNWKSPYGVYKFFVFCEFISGKFEDNIEIENSKYFRENKLPELSEGRNTRAQIEMCFNWKSSKEKEIEFD